MLNRPRFYYLHLITITCHNCQEEYVYPDVQLAREIPKGEAYSPAMPEAPVWDIPVRKNEVHRAVPFCSMCVNEVDRAELPPEREGILSVARGLNGGKPAPQGVSPEAATDILKTLGLL